MDCRLNAGQGQTHSAVKQWAAIGTTRRTEGPEAEAMGPVTWRQTRRLLAASSFPLPARSAGLPSGSMTLLAPRTLTRSGRIVTLSATWSSPRRMKRPVSLTSVIKRIDGSAMRSPNCGSAWSAVSRLENRMSFNAPPPSGPSGEHGPSVTEEIKHKLDEILASGRAQLIATQEMRSALAEIRRRIEASGPLILPRPSKQLPRAQKRRRMP